MVVYSGNLLEGGGYVGNVQEIVFLPQTQIQSYFKMGLVSFRERSNLDHGLGLRLHIASELEVVCRTFQYAQLHKAFFCLRKNTVFTLSFSIHIQDLRFLHDIFDFQLFLVTLKMWFLTHLYDYLFACTIYHSFKIKIPILLLTLGLLKTF